MRVFAFGCSMTRYAWPTWADIVARQIGAPYQNWANSGYGNVAILNRFIECDVKHCFQPDDLILVMWSSAIREDRFIDGGWSQHGNIYSQDFYDRHFVRKYWRDEDGMLKTLNAMAAVNRLLKSRSFVTAMCSIQNIDGYWNRERSPMLDRMIEAYQGELPTTTDLHAAVSHDWKWIKTWEDGGPDYHPLPSVHLAYVEQHVAPRLGIEVGQEVRDWARRWDDVVMSTKTIAEMRSRWCVEEPKGNF